MPGKRGVAVVVVLFFAFAIAIVMYVLISSNVNLAHQNRKTLHQLQAYYMAQSGLQHVKLKLRLLPKETYDLFESGRLFPVQDLDSGNHPPLKIFCDIGHNYSLFGSQIPIDTDAPYQAQYWVDSGDVKLYSSHQDMKHVQDGYLIKVSAKIVAGQKKEYTDTIQEEVIVSRFSAATK